MEPSAAYSAPLKAFTNALVEGYNTMDCLAGLVFGVIVVESIRFFGVKTNEEVARSAMKSGLISTFFMFIIYASLVVLGADSVSVLGHMETGAPVLSGASAYYFGTSGAVLLGLIVILACLTTSIGLIASCAAYFHQLFPMLHRQTWAALFAGFSFLIALFGLSAIIKGVSRYCFPVPAGCFPDHPDIPRQAFRRKPEGLCTSNGFHLRSGSL